MNASRFVKIIIPFISLTSNLSYGEEYFNDGKVFHSGTKDVILFRSFESLEKSEPKKLLEVTQIPLITPRDDGSPLLGTKDAGHNEFIDKDRRLSHLISGYSFFRGIDSAIEEAISNTSGINASSVKLALYYVHTSDSCEPCKGNKVYFIGPIIREPTEENVIRVINFASTFDAKIFAYQPNSIPYPTKVFYEQYFKHVARMAASIKTNTMTGHIRRTILDSANDEGSKFRSLNPIFSELVEAYAPDSTISATQAADLKKWASIHPYALVRLAAHRALINKGQPDASAEIIKNETNQAVKSKVGALLLQ